MQPKNTWLSKNVFGFGLTSFFNDFSHEMTTAILPMFVEQLIGTAATPLALGFISGISDAASSAAKIYSGFLTDRIQRYKPFLIVGYALTPLFSGIIGTAHAVWQILIYKTIAWVGRGMREPMRDTWLSNIVDQKYYGHAFGFNRALDTLGAVLGPLVTFFVLDILSLKTIFFISLIPGILSVLSLILLTHEDNEEQPNNPTLHWRQHLQELPTNYRYFVFTMFLFGVGNYNKLLIIFRAQELFMGQQDSFILATSSSILLYVLFNVIRAIAELGIGTLSDYVNRKKLLAFFGFGLFGIINTLLMVSSSTVAWILIFIGAGMSAGTISALERAYAAQLLPVHVRGIGFGILQLLDGLGDLISSIIVGTLWSAFFPNIGFLYATIISYIAMILLLTYKEN